MAGAKWGGFAWGSIEWALSSTLAGTAVGQGVLADPTLNLGISQLGDTGAGVLSVTLPPLSASSTGRGFLTMLGPGATFSAQITQDAWPVAWPQTRMPLAYITNRYDKTVIVSNPTTGSNQGIQSPSNPS